MGVMHSVRLAATLKNVNMMMSTAGDEISRVLAHIVAQHPGARVIDVGGGSGARAVPLAQAGASVLVVDVSTDALASLARRAAEAGVADRVESVQADADHLDELLPAACADAVLFHHMLAEVEDPLLALQGAVSVLRPGGYLSLLVRSKIAAAVAEIIVEQWDRAAVMATGTPPAGFYEADEVRALVAAAGLVTESLTGVGVISTITGHALREPMSEPLANLVQELVRHPLLGQLASELHILGMRPHQ